MSSILRFFFILFVLLGISLTLLSCSSGELSIELVPSYKQKFSFDSVSFHVSGPFLKEKVEPVTASFSDGSLLFPPLILDTDSPLEDHWLKFEVFGYKKNDKLVSLGATQLFIHEKKFQTVKILMSPVEKFSWLTGLETKQRVNFQGCIGCRAVPLKDGRILVIGGFNQVVEDKGLFWNASENRFVLNLSIYDPRSNLVEQGPALFTPRAFHSVTLLDDGRVLIAGGIAFINGKIAVTSTTEIYDPSTKKLDIFKPLPAPRAFHTVSKLNDGSLLFVGGIANPLDPKDDKTWPTQEVLLLHLLNPKQKTFAKVGILPQLQKRFFHRAVKFGPLDAFLITGGMNINTKTRKRELPKWNLLISAGSRSWRLTPVPAASSSLKMVPRFRHTATYVPNTNGKAGWVIVAGGRDLQGKALSSVEVWNSKGELIQTAFLKNPRYGHIAVLLADGKNILIAGGLDSNQKPVLKSELIPFKITGGKIKLLSIYNSDSIVETVGRYCPTFAIHPFSKRVFLFGGARKTSDFLFESIDSIEFYTPKLAPSP